MVPGSFVRAGVTDDAIVCLTLDTEHLQDAPGLISSSDGRFNATPLRPIPQLWHDPLSTLSFGEERIKNLVYAAAPTEDGGPGQDLLVIISLMQSSTIEVRFLRGAPGAPTTAAGPAASAVFGVFTLNRQAGSCSF